MSETVKRRLEKKYLWCEFIPPTDHGVNYEPIGSPEMFRHIRARRVRRWFIIETCRNCPEHLRIQRSVDSKQSLLKDMMHARCPICLEDSLEFFLQDLGPALDDEPCVTLKGEVWN